MLRPDERIVPMRLQRFLARAGAASRRGSESLMTAGRVRVNGIVVTELGSKVDPAHDVVTVDGQVFSIADRPTYLILNKPAGYVTTMRDPHADACVAELVPCDRYPGLFPVGRLDRDTTGLLLFTTDGDASHALLHPSHHVEKRYVALVDGRVSDAELVPLRRGITLDDGPCSPAKAVVLDPRRAEARPVLRGGSARGRSIVALTIHEGRKHQVKRMLEAIGHPVVRLHRDAFGPLGLDGLAEGAWRLLDDRETDALLRPTQKER